MEDLVKQTKNTVMIKNVMMPMMNIAVNELNMANIYIYIYIQEKK